MSVSKTLTANGSKGHHKFTLTVIETATSVTDNTSTVTIVFKLSPISTGWDWEDHSSVKGSVTVNETTYNWTRPTYNGSSTVTLVSKTQVITHSSDGTKTINLSFSCQSDTSYSYLPGTASASGSLTLTTIARESTLTVSGTKTLGNQVTLNVTRASGSYSHTITAKCGSSSSVPIVTKSTNLAPTFTLLTDWASQNTTGTSVSVTFTITTYKSDTKIGSSKTTTITASIPTSVKPTVTNIVIEPGDTASESHLTNYNGYVKGKSKLKITVTGEKSYSSNLTIFNITCDGKSYTGSPASTGGTTSTPITTSVLTTVGTTNVAKSTVTDARGRTSVNVSSSAFTVLDYNTPAITLALHRSDENGNEEMAGSYCRAEWDDTISSLNGFNSSTITLWKKISSSDTYEQITLTSEDLSNKKKIFPADDDKTYDIKVIITDDFMSVSAISSLSTGVVPIHFHKTGNGMGLGHMAVGSDRLDIGWNTYIKDVDHTLTKEEMTESGGLYPKLGISWSEGDPRRLYTVLDKLTDKADKTNATTSAAGLMSAADKTKLNAVGTIAGAVNGSTSIANKTIPGTGDWTNTGSFSLTAGLWIVKIHIRYNNNKNGARSVNLSTNPSDYSDSISVWNVMKVNACETNYTYLEMVTFLNPESTTTYYVNTSQNSGSSIACTIRWGAIRIK